MQQRIKRDPALFHLVSEYESQSSDGHSLYFEDKDYFQLINYYEDEHALDKALEVVELALHQYKFRAEFYTIKARLLLILGEVEEALELLQQAENIAPSELDIKLLKARALSEMECYQEAMSLVNQVKKVSQASELVDILFCEASIYEDSKEFAMMYNSLKEILLIDTDNEEALERIWVSVELCKNYDESVKFHSWLIEKDPYSYLAWYNLGHAYACLGNYRDSITSLEYSFLINEEFEMGYKDCAELCFQVCDFKMALSVYLEALKKFGNDSELLSSAAQCFIKLNKYETAKIFLEKSSKIDPYNDEVFYFLGECSSYDGKWAHAIRYYIKAIQLEDRREEYYAGLAYAYENIEDYTKANYYYSKATETGPEEPEYWYKHSKFLVSIGAFDAACQVLEEADFHTFGTNLLYCRAAVYFHLNDKKEAMNWLHQALKEKSEDAHLLSELCPEALKQREILSMIEYYQKG